MTVAAGFRTKLGVPPVWRLVAIRTFARILCVESRLVGKGGLVRIGAVKLSTGCERKDFRKFVEYYKYRALPLRGCLV